MLEASKLIGEAAAKHGVARFVDLSTAQVYEPNDKAAAEGSKLKPWTKQAAFKLKAEELLRELKLPLVVLRPAIVYGPADVHGLSPRVIVAAVYRQLGGHAVLTRGCVWRTAAGARVSCRGSCVPLARAAPDAPPQGRTHGGRAGGGRAPLGAAVRLC